MTDEQAGRPESNEPQILIDPSQMAGVWANQARVSHSPYEFTLDFVRLDFTQAPVKGIVVARVSLSPLMVSQLIEALGDNWDKYAQKAMPPEVRREPPDTEDDPERPGGPAAQTT